MANRTATWNPDAGEATYLSLSAAEAAEQTIGANLVSLGDTLTFQAIGSWSVADTTAATINGFTTGASNWILVNTDSSNRWVGTAWDTAKARLLPSSVAAGFEIQDDYVTVLGLQVENSNTGFGIRVGAATNVLFDACFVRGRTAIGTNNAASQYRARNCLVTGGATAMRTGFAVATSGGSATLHACTAGPASTTQSYRVDTGCTLTVYNCLGTTNAAGVFGGAGTLNGNYNAATDTTAPGANSIQSATFTFVNAGAGDYRIDASDTSGVIGGGTDLSADATLPVVYDAGGTNLRPAAPTMGMWEADPATGDVDIDLTGSSATITQSAGTIAPDVQITLGGSSLAVAVTAGTVDPISGVELSLTGSALGLALSGGSVSAQVDATLAGSVADLSPTAGTIAAAVDASLTGSALGVTLSAGAVSQDVSMVLTGALLGIALAPGALTLAAAPTLSGAFLGVAVNAGQMTIEGQEPPIVMLTYAVLLTQPGPGATITAQPGPRATLTD